MHSFLAYFTLTLISLLTLTQAKPDSPEDGKKKEDKKKEGDKAAKEGDKPEEGAKPEGEAKPEQGAKPDQSEIQAISFEFVQQVGGLVGQSFFIYDKDQQKMITELTGEEKNVIFLVEASPQVSTVFVGFLGLPVVTQVVLASNPEAKKNPEAKEEGKPNDPAKGPAPGEQGPNPSGPAPGEQAPAPAPAPQ